ncbi:MAG: carboxypeptidase-like regulatory domain-containing protein [Terracidiphilus sp.]
MGPNDPRQAGTGEISGTVIDTSGDAVEGAHVTLSSSVDFNKRTVVSGSNGLFAFMGLPSAVCKTTVSGQGMSTFTSDPIPLREDDALIVPQIALAVSDGSTTVTVNGNKEELAEEQVRTAVQQRVIGIIPNFYSSYG